MARTGLIVGVAATLGLGIADLSYLNLRLVPQVLGGSATQEPAPAPEVADEAPALEVADVPAALEVAHVPPALEVADEPALEVADEPPAVEIADEPPPREAPVPEGAVVRFATDSVSLIDAGADELDRIAALLRDRDDLRVVIAGHADQRGTPAHNHALGERRAKWVARYLDARGVSLERVSLESFGESRPAAEGRDPASLRRNRRVEIIVKRGQP